ncbi:MAG: flagellar hook-associated protein FlgK [Candidatus Brocadia sinica]|nr:MAG: flagellar hook-associated protein FlgK [Candidatus Brocadia sinica]MCK6467012.1 flagellar hook-associated protein FlgK [Candidatus Brocadia sinica]NUO04843.1 flagellar hook-associated protein FlgK [Candidatus Brocadia sinica]
MSSDLQIGLSGILAAQRAMLVTAHNISNSNTKGYTRQSTIMATKLPVMTTAGTIGQGVEIVKIIRHKDDYLNSRLRDISSSLGNASIQSQYLRELETVFNETSEASLNNALASFFRGINDLSQNAQNISSRATLLEKANTLTDTFHRTVNELNQMKIFVKQSIESKISDVNNLTANIASINKQISALKVKGIESNDLLDKREALLLDLSKLINITVISQDNGIVNVATSGGTLVSGTNSTSITTEIDTSGDINVVNSRSENSKYVFKTGEIKGLQSFYNETIVNYDDKLDTLASGLIKDINRIHSEGVGLSGGFASILSTNTVSSTTAALDSAGLDIMPTSGDIYITVINTSTGEVTKNKISVDVTTDSLTDLQTSIDGLANISASIVDNKLLIKADSGYKYNFSYALDPNPGSLGTSTVSVSGIYSGQSNDVYTFTALGTGTIGSTAGLQIEVKNSSGAVIATLDVGSDYTPGNIINVANGVSLSFSGDAITSGDTLSLDVINDSDTTDLLAALGINTFFSGSDASDIAINPDIDKDVSLIAASTGEIGNNTNALRLAALQDDTSAIDNTTFGDYLHQIASSLGEEASNAYKSEESFTALETSLGNRRDEISGVSTDEELVNLVRFQQAYQASAKYISIVDGLVERLLSSFG